jgi:hypothetical protein
VLAPLLALASLRFRNQSSSGFRIEKRSLIVIDFIIVASAFLAVLAVGYGDKIYRLFGHRLMRLNDHSVKQAAAILVLAIILRTVWLLFSFIRRLRRGLRRPSGSRFNVNFSESGIDSIGVGLIWLVSGFLAAMGGKFFLNRWLHDYLFLYQSIRIPSRAAMICYLGLAVLAGAGAAQLGRYVRERFSIQRVEALVAALIGLAVMVELHASPLRFEAGEVDPSALALRLKQTPMRGGLVELPSATGDYRHFYMLRAADHGRPLINATSSFISPLTEKINQATEHGISPNFMDLLEQIPASYLAIHYDRLPSGWRAEYEIFLQRALVAGRLRFVNRFDDHDDLYAIVKTEPEARQENPLPFQIRPHEWSVMIQEDPINLLAAAGRCQTLYRIYVAGTGALPRYSEFMRDVETVARGVLLDSETQDQIFQDNLREFLTVWLHEEPQASSLSGLSDAEFIDRLVSNAGIKLEPERRSTLIADLVTKRESRAALLLKIAADPAFIEKENDRSMVLLHYFAYLRRDPGEFPDKDLTGFNFWLQELARDHNAAKLQIAFWNSIEYRQSKEGK